LLLAPSRLLLPRHSLRLISLRLPPPLDFGPGPRSLLRAA
ncbi:hypothetical protein BN1723_018353, partial [Verticillium longisporum]